MSMSRLQGGEEVCSSQNERKRDDGVKGAPTRRHSWDGRGTVAPPHSVRQVRSSHIIMTNQSDYPSELYRGDQRPVSHFPVPEPAKILDFHQYGIRPPQSGHHMHHQQQKHVQDYTSGNPQQCRPSSVSRATSDSLIPAYYVEPSPLHPSQISSSRTEPPQQVPETAGVAAQPQVLRKAYPPLPPPGAVPHVVCQHCGLTLAVPDNLPPSKKPTQKLRCGACMKISIFSVHSPEQVGAIPSASPTRLEHEQYHQRRPNSSPLPLSGMPSGIGKAQNVDLYGKVGEPSSVSQMRSPATSSEDVAGAFHYHSPVVTSRLDASSPSGDSDTVANSEPASSPPFAGSPGTADRKTEEWIQYGLVHGGENVSGNVYPVLGHGMPEATDQKDLQDSSDFGVTSDLHQVHSLSADVSTLNFNPGDVSGSDSSFDTTGEKSPLGGRSPGHVFGTSPPPALESQQVQDQPKGLNKAFKGFFNMTKTVKEFTKSKQGQAQGNYRRRVAVNGIALPDYVVKKAEESAGPLHPGSYWYDIRAGFWGVSGGPCLGIIPPFIEEFNYPMPRNCANGRTNVLVNGRELHIKDLEVLSRRGLPPTPGMAYSVDIDGRVCDDASGSELKNLGRLAPSLERKGRGHGMYVPPSSSPGVGNRNLSSHHGRTDTSAVATHR